MVTFTIIQRAGLPALFFCLVAGSAFGMGSRLPKDTTPPQVSITSPLNNATVSGAVSINVSAKDNKGIAKVGFYVDNSLKTTDTSSPYSYSWDTASATNASHTLKVIAYDTNNNSKQAQINVTVNNVAPPPPSPPPPAGPELAITSASASSTYSKSHLASKTIDKNLVTYWRGSWGLWFRPSYWWLTLDMAKAYSLERISIFWNNTHGSTNYFIQGSVDNKAWVNLASNQSSTGGKANPAQKNHAITGTYRYLRVYISKAQKYYPIIYEVKLFGTPVAEPQNQPPQINSLQPQDGSVFLAGAKIPLKISAADPDGGTLKYQFSIGGKIKQAWSTSDTFNWQTSAADTGTVTITAEAKDPKGLAASKIIAYRIINPTAEEVLQRVADNYAKIYDFKADMTISSTLDGKPFSATDYCRYYFKAPNKEKTDSFTDSTRNTKTESIIINGATMYLVDVINKLSQAVDLLGEAGINAAQFNQMDIYYNQPNFLESHTVTRNNVKTDFVNTVVALDAIPKTPNSLYSKLELYVDYNKGLVLKSCLYKENESKLTELLQTMEVIETQQIPGGAWLPKKMNKIPVLESGKLIESASYNNLEVNTGLTDLEFDVTEQY